jgi:chemosensory pili system protein ChpA (sensor histidine kinase/response regulator)
MQRLAAEKGAKGYFVKPYIEDALLEASQRLMAGEVLLDINVLAED